MATSSDIAVYRNQVMVFLRTLTIKFSPIADRYNTTLQGYGVATPDDMAQWKYYLNLQGLYHSSDTPMYVTSLDTQEVISFDVKTLKDHPRTTQGYTPGSVYHADLIARYPEQVDLIKSILYPISDVESAISADDFTILACSNTVLEASEYAYILRELQTQLTYIGKRWYMQNLQYEPYYNVVFWGLLWQFLPQVIFSARFKAIRTADVHSWFVWEYLNSFGIDNYSDILDRQRTMWLYRNIDYLMAHRGSRKNLGLLADNILDIVGIGLFERKFAIQTQDTGPSCQNVPDLVAVKVPTKYSEISDDAPAQSIEDIVYRQFTSGDEVDISAEHIADLTDQFATSKLNQHPSKLLEIRPLLRSKRYTEYFNRLIVEMVTAGINFGYYTPSVELALLDTSVAEILSGKDVLIALYYCMFRAMGVEPTVIPHSFTAQCMYRQNPLPIVESFNLEGNIYYTQQLVDVEGYVGNYQKLFPSLPVTDSTVFSEFVSSLYEVGRTQLDRGRLALDYLPQAKALEYITNSITYQGQVDLNLSSVSTYDAWFAQHPGFKEHITTALDASTDVTSVYNNMADKILTQLIPMTKTMQTYGNFAVSTSAFKRLKKLFIQMCSYTVTFLDTDREVGTELYIAGYGVSVHTTQGSDIHDIGLSPTDLSKSSGTYPIEASPDTVAVTDIDHSFDKTHMDNAYDPSASLEDVSTDDTFVEQVRVVSGRDYIHTDLIIESGLVIMDTIES